MSASTMDRRTFVKAAGATAAVAAVAAGAGTAMAADAADSKAADSKAADDDNTTNNTAEQTDLDPLPTDLPDAEPIAPLDPPATWDDEADVVIVGLGGGGLAASVYCAEAGVKTISVEKNPDVGGATQHACGWFTLPGGSKAQNDKQYAYPQYPYNTRDFVRAVEPYYNYTADERLLARIADKGGECEDWMIDHGEPLACQGPVYLDTRVKNGIQPLGMRYVCQDMKQKAIDAGDDMRLSTECTGLVKDGDAIVGIQTTDSDGNTKFIKADKGVILCTGSFGTNRDMLAKYCPTAYRYAAVGGPIPGADGACTRMAIGAGADMAGYDSWCCWEAYPDRFHDGDGSFYTFHWDGSVILCRQPWLTIDKRGNRCTYYTASTDEHATSFGGDGDYINAATHMSRQGGGAYVIFDSHYEENVLKLHPVDGNPFLDDRTVLTPERIEAAGIDGDEVSKYCSQDWRDDVKTAIDHGNIKKGDTLEELAEQLGLDPEVVTTAVDKWNATCEKGEDDDTLYPLKPEWLIPIQDGPFYGARISGGIGKTFCGPRVTPNLEVVDTNGHVIPGLYAHFLTAGGICGEDCFNGTMFNTSIQGGNALSWISGYTAAQSVLGELDEQTL